MLGRRNWHLAKVIQIGNFVVTNPTDENVSKISSNELFHIFLFQNSLLGLFKEFNYANLEKSGSAHFGLMSFRNKRKFPLCFP